MLLDLVGWGSISKGSGWASRPMRALCCFGVPGGRLSVSELGRFVED
jgi:hypothetical protein